MPWYMQIVRFNLLLMDLQLLNLKAFIAIVIIIGA